ncbi:MAG TPA: glycine zipper 2TM domain-containing protein [Methylophilaceae bacterium]|jgi:uncharacterized protein YcfJ
MPKFNVKPVKMIIPALMAVSLSLPVMANDQYYDNARVVSVTPQTARVNTPRQECHTEYVQSVSNDRSPLGAIIGGVAGAIIGSQVGHGNGRVAAGAVGAGVGAVVGDRIDNDHPAGYVTRPVESCYTADNWQTVTSGYLVTYRYNGRDYSTVMPNDPGDNIRVRVDINPGYRDDRVSYQPVLVEQPAVIYQGGYGHRDWGHERDWDRHHDHHDDD